MKTRTFLALVLAGLLAAGGCGDKARDVKPDADKEKPKDGQVNDADKKKKEEEAKKAKEEKEKKEKEEKEKAEKEKAEKEKDKDKKSGEPERLGDPNVEKGEGNKDEPTGELLGPPEVEK